MVDHRKKKLYPVAKRNGQAGRKTRMVRDKLFVDVKLYEESDPPQTDPRSYRDVVNVQPTPNRNRNSLRSAHPTRGTSSPRSVPLDPPRNVREPPPHQHRTIPPEADNSTE